jgi:hypothetical protein
MGPYEGVVTIKNRKRTELSRDTIRDLSGCIRAVIRSRIVGRLVIAIPVAHPLAAWDWVTAADDLRLGAGPAIALHGVGLTPAHAKLPSLLLSGFEWVRCTPDLAKGIGALQSSSFAATKRIQHPKRSPRRNCHVVPLITNCHLSNCRAHAQTQHPVKMGLGILEDRAMAHVPGTPTTLSWSSRAPADTMHRRDDQILRRPRETAVRCRRRRRPQMRHQRPSPRHPRPAAVRRP